MTSADLAAGHDVRPLLDPAQAARQLGIATEELFRLIDRGDVPAYRLADEIRLRPSEVDRYQRARREPWARPG